jgi:hypothetical protein
MVRLAIKAFSVSMKKLVYIDTFVKRDMSKGFPVLGNGIMVDED